MSGTSPLIAAARVRPPSVNNKTTVALTGATAITVSTGALSSDHWFMFVINVAFNITFNDNADAISDPTDNGVFPAGVYGFELNASNTSCKIMPNANGVVIHWRSSRS